MPDLKYHCSDCKTAADCKQAFGKFWRDRSHGGVGCNASFAYTSLRKLIVGGLASSSKSHIRQGRLI